MAKDRETYDTYPKDVFDNPPVGPVGVHRGAKSVGARMAPFLIVLFVVALLGVGVWGVFSGTFGEILHSQTASQSTTASGSSDTATDSANKDSDSSSAQDDNANASDTSADQGASTDNSSDAQSSSADGQNSSTSPSTDGTTSENTPDTSDAQQTAPEPTQTANKATTVRVVNGTRISGHAASKAYVLQQAGYTNVVATNPSGSLPSSTVVWYQNETDLATAKDVAATLGISNVSQVSGIAAPVVVVLMQ